MGWLIWGGAALTLLGLVGIVWSAILVMRARRAADDEKVLRDRLQKLLPLNLGALAISALGLMAVILGISLGG